MKYSEMLKIKDAENSRTTPDLTPPGLANVRR
jgi:hypothetical protein